MLTFLRKCYFWALSSDSEGLRLFNREVYSARPSLFGATQPRHMALGRPQIHGAFLDVEAARHQQIPPE